MRKTVLAFAAALAVMAAITPAGASTPDQPDTYGDYWIDFSDQHTVDDLWATSSGSIEELDCEDTGSGGVVTEWRLRVRNAGDYRESEIRCNELRDDGELTVVSDRQRHFSYEQSGTDRTTSTAPHRLPVGVTTFLDFRFLTAIKVFDVALIEATVSDVVERTGVNRVTSRATYDLANSPAYEILCDPGYVVTGVDVRAKHGAGGPNQAEIRAVRLTCSRLHHNEPLNSVGGLGRFLAD